MILAAAAVPVQEGSQLGKDDICGSGAARNLSAQHLGNVCHKQLALQQQPSDPNKAVLLRDFIHNSLYHPTRGFFNAKVPPVGTLLNPINYWKIYCKAELDVVISKKYKELEVAFLTPAELFSPWYGAILARHMFEHRKHNLLSRVDEPLNVVEIGGGNGTLARDILDWIRDNRPDDYLRTTYTCIEVSSRLAVQQYQTVVAKGGHVGRFRLLRGSGWDVETWGARDYTHTFILMMEVLDNLPHDRVYRARPSAPWEQTVVRPEKGVAMEDGPWVEETQPLTDPLLARCLDAIYKPPTLEDKVDIHFNKILDFLLSREGQQKDKGEIVFVPTASLALLDIIHGLRPNHSLIAADFDALPDVSVAGTNAPLVAEKVDGVNIDHKTIYVPWGKADIFFPTDFDALADMYGKVAGHIWGTGPELGKVSAEHFRQGAVMKRYKEMFNTATICAFNPMIDDFLNARFFFGDSLERLPPGSHTAERSPMSAKRRLALAAASSAIKPPLPAAPFSKSAVNPPKNPVYPTFGGKGVRPMKKKF
ncbi:MAG: hypothetical protein WDW36_003761 [Sanguina aurantia]